MSTDILLIPESPAWAYPVRRVQSLVQSIWPSAVAHDLSSKLFDVRVEIADRGIDVHVGPSLVSISAGSTLDDCALVAHRIVEGLNASTPFRYMDSGNNHALLVDRTTPRSVFASLPGAPPM